MMQPVMVSPSVTALVDRVARALSALTDGDLEVIGASSTMAADVLATAASKAAGERGTRHGYEKQRDDITREIGSIKDRLPAIEVELKDIRGDRTADDWAREPSPPHQRTRSSAALFETLCVTTRRGVLRRGPALVTPWSARSCPSVT